MPLEYGSAVDENIDYYVDHPDKYTPAKIWKETWLPERVRARISVSLYEVTGYAQRQRRARQARNLELQGVVKAPRKGHKRFKFILDKNKVSHKINIKNGQFARLNRAERQARARIIRQGVKQNRQTTLKKPTEKH